MYTDVLSWTSSSSPWVKFLDTYGHQVVEILVGGGAEAQALIADVIQSLVVDAERLIGVHNKLVQRQRGVIWLHHHLGHLRPDKFQFDEEDVEEEEGMGQTEDALDGLTRGYSRKPDG